MSTLHHLFIFILVINSTPSIAENSWDKMLKKADLKRSDIQFMRADLALFGGMNYSSKHFENLMRNPLGAPSYIRIEKNRIYSKAKNLDHTLLQTLARIGVGPRRNLVGDPNANLKKQSEAKGSLLKGIQGLAKLGNKAVSARDKANISKIQKQLPEKFTQSLAYLMLVLEKAQRQRHKAFKKVANSTIKNAVRDFTQDQKHSYDIFQPIPKSLLQLTEKFDLKALTVGAIDLSIGLEKAKDELKDAGKKDLKPLYSRLDTPLGAIIIDTRKKASTHKGPFLFVIDTHGNDTYLAGKSILGAPSLILDLSGNDKYLYNSSLKTTEVKEFKSRKDQSQRAFASGFMGYSFLLDFAGDDLYRGLSYAFGSGVFGVGMLWDFFGDDTYDCYNFCTGAAYFGAGVLVDASGKDTFTAFRKAQGYAGTKGSSVLINWGNEDDQYIAHKKPIDFPSYYDKEVNASYSQGMSLGYRADYIDQVSWAGGYALLMDAGGNNTFSAGVYAQGAAYWYGVGALLSGSGNDSYSSSKYSLGSGVHYGVGLVDDQGGNDSYKVTQELGIAAGHDFSLGMLIDHSGDDTYKAVNLSFGCGSANGIGLFWDRDGDDTYAASDIENFGCASDRISRHSIRNRNKTFGLFLDSKGNNQVTSKIEDLEGKVRKERWFRRAQRPVKPKFTKNYYYGLGLFSQKLDSEFPDGFPYDSEEFVIE